MIVFVLEYLELEIVGIGNVYAAIEAEEPVPGLRPSRALQHDTRQLASSHPLRRIPAKCICVVGVIMFLKGQF
ncbi:hypothetical protein JB92DRAFT_2801734 [Gautieria morchelliformis]|nr:hypothetical protein JB92DRAFT_2801734 [Gautieria morchelliformis]